MKKLVIFVKTNYFQNNLFIKLLNGVHIDYI